MKTLKSTTAIALLTAVALFAVSCGGGKKQNRVNATETKTETKAAKGSVLFEIPKDKIDAYHTGDGTDLNLAFSEIPAEVFKGVGELNSAHIMLSKYGVFKYDVILKFKVKSGKDAAKELADYYKSIGATVEELSGTETSAGYKVKFGDWGESVEVKGYSAYLDVQLNVVKK